LVSCEDSIEPFQKEKAQPINIQDGIPIFNSNDELLEAVKISFINSKEQRVIWEEQNGIISFGTYCDKLYHSIDFDNIESSEEVFSFVRENNSYLQLIENDNGEYILETMLPTSSYRYVVNMDRMYQVNNKIYKIYEKGIAVAMEEDIELLKSASDELINKFTTIYNIEFMPFDVETTQKATSEWCGNTFFHDDKINGNNKTYFSLELEQNTQSWGTTSFVHYYIRPYKKTLGIWFYCSRTISWDINCYIYGRTVTGEWPYGKEHLVGTQGASLVEGNIAWFSSPDPDYIYSDVVHYYVDAWVDTPAVIFQCNTEAIN